MPLTDAEVRDLITGSLAEPLRAAGLDPADVPEDLDLIARGIVDSLGFLELISELEQRLGFEADFEDADPDQLAVLGYIARLAAEQASADGAAA